MADSATSGWLQSAYPHPFVEDLNVTHCAEAARRPDKQRLVDVVSILVSGILRVHFASGRFPSGWFQRP